MSSLSVMPTRSYARSFTDSKAPLAAEGDDVAAVRGQAARLAPEVIRPARGAVVEARELDAPVLPDERRERADVARVVDRQAPLGEVEGLPREGLVEVERSVEGVRAVRVVVVVAVGVDEP